MRLIHAFEGRDLLLRLGYISQFHDAARRKPIPDQLRATYKVAPHPPQYGSPTTSGPEGSQSGSPGANLCTQKHYVLC
ncbi:hypothetical protein MRX96_001719 [Rhipicephalus microplus]